MVGSGRIAGGRVRGRIGAVGGLVASLDLPYQWIPWSVPRGVLYRHEDDEGDGDAGRKTFVQHASFREEYR